MTVWERVLAKLSELSDRQDDLHRKVDQILAKENAPAGQQAEADAEAQDTA